MLVHECRHQRSKRLNEFGFADNTILTTIKTIFSIDFVGIVPCSDPSSCSDRGLTRRCLLFEDFAQLFELPRPLRSRNML